MERSNDLANERPALKLFGGNDELWREGKEQNMPRRNYLWERYMQVMIAESTVVDM